MTISTPRIDESCLFYSNVVISPAIFKLLALVPNHNTITQGCLTDFPTIYKDSFACFPLSNWKALWLSLRSVTMTSMHTVRGMSISILSIIFLVVTSPVCYGLLTMSSAASKAVLVIGGTGRVGRALVPKLVKEGFSVRVMCRDMEKAKQLTELSGAYMHSSRLFHSIWMGICPSSLMILQSLRPTHYSHSSFTPHYSLKLTSHYSPLN